MNQVQFSINFEEAFNAAVKREENFKDGTINWDFIDADVVSIMLEEDPMMELSDFDYYRELYEDLFDTFATNWEQENELVWIKA